MRFLSTARAAEFLGMDRFALRELVKARIVVPRHSNRGTGHPDRWEKGDVLAAGITAALRRGDVAVPACRAAGSFIQGAGLPRVEDQRGHQREPGGRPSSAAKWNSPNPALKDNE